MKGQQLGREHEFGRREFLAGATVAGIALALPFNAGALERQRRRPYATEGSFFHGVSSGLPSPRSITLWTRVSDLDRTSSLTLEVATDNGFRKVVERRPVMADSRRDYTVHALVEGLSPARQYYYRFYTKSTASRVGRFRTLPPADSKQTVRIGFFSCQAYEAGYFTAHAALARERDLDLVICLGDYIYERAYYEAGEGPADRIDQTGINGDGDVQTLDEYRQKYRLYQADENLQALHAAHPFVSIWDDHELEDDYNAYGASSRQTDPALDGTSVLRRVPFEARQVNAYRAYFESMPRIRNEKDGNRIFGSLKLGGVAELFLTDQRQYRDRQPCRDSSNYPCEFNETPGRTMLGRPQKRWLKKALAESPADWKLWGSQSMIMSLDLFPGVHARADQWDGYAYERLEVLNHFYYKGVENLAVLSGDTHMMLSGDLCTTGEVDGEPIGVELSSGSMTSLVSAGFPAAKLLEMVSANDPHIKFADFYHRGYGVVTVTDKSLTSDVKAVESIFTPRSRPLSLAKFRVDKGKPELIQV